VSQYRCTGLKIHLLYLLWRPRGGTVLARAAVRSLCTQKPTPKEYDSWARAPCQRLGRCFWRSWRGALPRVVVRLLHTRRPARHLYDLWAQALCHRLGGCFRRRWRGTLPRAAVRLWRFAFSALGDQHTSCMTCGPGPPCHRLGCFGACWARFSAASRGASRGVFLEKGFTPRAAVTLSHSFQLLRPFAFELSAPPLHLRSSAFRRRSRHGLASLSRALLVRGGTQPSAQPAWMGRSDVRRKDPRRRLSPQRSRRWGVRALRLLWVGAADLAFLPATVGGARPPASARGWSGADTSSASAWTKGCCAATFRRWKAS
jgi:hypothetical protein